jgi:hypothetical protein
MKCFHPKKCRIHPSGAIISTIDDTSGKRFVLMATGKSATLTIIMKLKSGYQGMELTVTAGLRNTPRRSRRRISVRSSIPSAGIRTEIAPSWDRILEPPTNMAKTTP